MDSQNLQLFSHDQNKVVLPSVKVEDTEKSGISLMSEGVLEDISGETVKTLRIKEEFEIDPNNFILDLSDVGQVTAAQKDVIKSLIAKDGDTAIYLYKKQGLIKLGVGNKYSLERVLPILKVHVFDNAIRIYKNFSRGCAVNEIDTKDITKLRLGL